MPRFIKLTLPTLEGGPAAQPVMINVDRIEGFLPRMAAVKEGVLTKDQTWVEQGTYIKMSGSDEESTFYVTEGFRMVERAITEAMS